MRINNNLMAMNTHRQLGINNAESAKSTEKLSSGFRINRAGDDAAGLAISEKMRGQIRGLDQASRNSQDGISMIQTAEGALNETQAILQRMRELSTQSANDTNTADDRGEIQKEMNELTSEISRIGNTTEFNTQNVLKGATATGDTTNATAVAGVAVVAGAALVLDTGNITALTVGQTGTIEMAGVTINITTGAADVAAANFDGTSADLVLNQTENAAAQAIDIAAALTDYAASGAAGSQLDDYTFAAVGDTITATAGTNGASTDLFTVSGDLTMVSNATTQVTTAGVTAVTAVQGTTGFTIDTPLAAGETITVGGETITAYENAAALAAANSGAGDANGIDIETATTATLQAAAITAMSGEFAGVTVTNVAGAVTLTQDVGGTGDITDATAVSPEGGDDFSATLQIGANQSQSFELTISDMRSSALGISGDADAVAAGVGTEVVAGATFAATDVLSDSSEDAVEYALDVSTAEKASAAITVLDQALSSVSSERSKLGASQNRLEHTIKNLDTSSENLQAAESRIRDVDMADEIMTNSKNSILAQAAQAMLAQANSAPEGVLQLLR